MMINICIKAKKLKDFKLKAIKCYMRSSEIKKKLPNTFQKDF